LPQLQIMRKLLQYHLILSIKILIDFILTEGTKVKTEPDPIKFSVRKTFEAVEHSH